MTQNWWEISTAQFQKLTTTKGNIRKDVEGLNDTTAQKELIHFYRKLHPASSQRQQNVQSFKALMEHSPEIDHLPRQSGLPNKPQKI